MFRCAEAREGEAVLQDASTVNDKLGHAGTQLIGNAAPLVAWSVEAAQGLSMGR